MILRSSFVNIGKEGSFCHLGNTIHRQPGLTKNVTLNRLDILKKNLSTGTSICTVLETSTVAKDRHQDNSALLASTNTTKNNDGVARASVRW